ncbi:hypothetical protein KBD45_00780 [Candidatus Dojkabacteria bacterium]|nr:hypothetical protein [Candidatus Dojkabacteria bacterium]
MSAKVDEYFELRDQIRTIKADLKDLVDDHEVTERIDELRKEMKELKGQMEEDEGIVAIQNKIKDLKERQDLLKEIILVEMKESGQDKIEYNGNEILITEGLKFQKIKR